MQAGSVSAILGFRRSDQDDGGLGHALARQHLCRRDDDVGRQAPSPVDGSTASSKTAVTVNGGTLGGTGTINGSATVNSPGNLTPGDTGSTGVITTDNLWLGSGSNFNVAINGTTVGNGSMQAVATGTINLTGATLNVNAELDFDHPGHGLRPHQEQRVQPGDGDVQRAA